ncbi:histidine phosphatase family protein [uncultured Roseibium sp.]|uniref:histidine phosphatase family protein n=1 Tax=uncultured Roseibium sp. TaxID=1936171 RepID=UPI00260CB633|nr:histidine phosphatase family protein [uncultured Roseibium sp.]
MPIYFVRHGQSEFNAVFRTGDEDPMIFDAPLTELGRQQAMDAREEIRDLGIRHVITSPLTRAIQTAQLMFPDGISMEVRDGHHELLLHSCDVGRPPNELGADFPALAFGHLADEWWHSDGTGGISVEPEDVFKARIADFVRHLDTIMERPLLIVGHGNAFNEIIGRKLANCEVHRFR